MTWDERRLRVEQNLHEARAARDEFHEQLRDQLHESTRRLTDQLLTDARHGFPTYAADRLPHAPVLFDQGGSTIHVITTLPEDPA